MRIIVMFTALVPFLVSSGRDGTKPWLNPPKKEEEGLLPGLYPMIDGKVDPARFQDQAWQYNGVIVTLDGREIPACFSANTKGYVELLNFRETPHGLDWKTVRAIGDVKISFVNKEVEKRYKRWLKGQHRGA